MTEKIRSFTDLVAWQEAHKLVVNVYALTREFPNEEKFSLVDQMRRSAISISSNIAEGFSRRGKREKAQFYFTARGSITELQNQLLVAKDVGYVSKEKFEEVANKTVHVHKLVNGLIRSSLEA